MAQINRQHMQFQARTHEGAPTIVLNAAHELQRCILSCMLWEDQYYESGIKMADRIASLVGRVDATTVMELAILARTDFKLRHVPLLLAREMARLSEHKQLVAHTLEQIIQRPDEITEFLAIYWKDKRQPLSAQVKKGLAAAFNKFNEYSLAKYNNQDKAVKLRDALFLCHAKPKDKQQEGVFKRLVENTMPIPDTWETQLSAGADKKATFIRLMEENKLGGLAFLRNLRNMSQVKVPRDLIQAYADRVDVSRVLPFRFIAAATYAPEYEGAIENAMLRACGSLEDISGPTAVIIDHSGSMRSPVSSNSDITRFDAASAIAILVREKCKDARIFTFSDRCIEVPARKGFALRDAILKVVNPVGTRLGMAVRYVNEAFSEARRFIVITDEQSQDRPPAPRGNGYIINVAGYQNGISYGDWITISGWSEAVIPYIHEWEKFNAKQL